MVASMGFISYRVEMPMLVFQHQVNSLCFQSEGGGIHNRNQHGGLWALFVIRSVFEFERALVRRTEPSATAVPVPRAAVCFGQAPCRLHLCCTFAFAPCLRRRIRIHTPQPASFFSTGKSAQRFNLGLTQFAHPNGPLPRCTFNACSAQCPLLLALL